MVSDPAALRLAECVVEQLQAVLQGVEEGDLFLADHALNPRDALLELGVRLAHHLGDDRHDLRQERVAPAHLVGVEHGPTEQPTQDVALLLVPRADILVNAKRQGPRVVGHPPDADAGGIIGLVGQAERVSDAGDDRLENIGAEDRGGALQAGRPRRSRPIPVSMFFFGNGSSCPGPTRLNCVKTRFQISTSLGPLP